MILKVAPRETMRIMTYETGIMHSEVEAMRMAASVTGIPVPKVLGFDESREICDSSYFFMEKLPGRSLSSVRDTLSEQTLQDIYCQTGKIIRCVNEISCPCFGYPAQPEFQGIKWFPVFKRMLEAGVEDAVSGGVDLTISVELLWSLLERDRDVFDEVVAPQLVHWDCWDGNIFVQDGRVTGIIDWERCLWGDPLMEVNFRTYQDNTWFCRGYGLEKLTDSQKLRALWYDVYLMLLVSLECEYRKYDTMDMYDWGTRTLRAQLDKIAGYEQGKQQC